MSRRLYWLLLSAGILAAAGGLFWIITPASTAAESPFEVVASGLNNPRGLDFDSEGVLYVAEAGTDGDNNCIPGPFPDSQVCLGATGAVTRVKDGRQKRVVAGLPSLSDPASGGNFAFGPHDVSAFDRRPFLAIGMDNTVEAREQLGSAGDDLARLFRLRHDGTLKNIADLAAYEAANNPDDGQAAEGQPELRSNPHRVLDLPDGALLIDSGANSLLQVDDEGIISTVAVFPERLVEFPPRQRRLGLHAVGAHSSGPGAGRRFLRG
jgi:hypothetical protein